MAVIGERLAQPETGWKRYDDSVGLIKYEGTWQSNMPNASSWMGTRHISSNLPDKVIKFVFKGTKLRILVNSASNRSENSTISIDGEIHTFSSRFTTTLTIAPTRLAFEKIDLPHGYHTVIISDTTTDYIDIDAIDIDTDGELVRYDYLDNSELPELMRKYGNSWFKFDEETGTALDALPTGFIGTPYNVVTGEDWRGDGYSPSFNGTNSYMNFNNPLIPVGEKTIRFKFKHNIQPTSSSNAHVLFANTPNSTGHGLLVSINGTAGFNIVYGNGNTSSSISLITNKFYNDGKWHEFHFSWDGQVGSKIYLKVGEDEFVFLAQYKESGGFSNNARLGRGLGTTPFYARCLIDDIQIYGKVLSPDNFNNKNVVIDSPNGAYSLPSKQGRVKEILDANDKDIANQGYKWLEIDSAVDKDGVNLTQSTTEYEIVGKDNSSLGSGKIFTLPISNFKTVKIEKNY